MLCVRDRRLGLPQSPATELTDPHASHDEAKPTLVPAYGKLELPEARGCAIRATEHSMGDKRLCNIIVLAQH